MSASFNPFNNIASTTNMTDASVNLRRASVSNTLEELVRATHHSSAVRPGHQPTTHPFTNPDSEINEQPQPVPTTSSRDLVCKSRIRRRRHEVPRYYQCTWKNCNRSYGTLGNLNQHIVLQGHGPRRHPDEFAHIREQLRKTGECQRIVTPESSRPGSRRLSVVTDFGKLSGGSEDFWKRNVEPITPVDEETTSTIQVAQTDKNVVQRRSSVGIMNVSEVKNDGQKIQLPPISTILQQVPIFLNCSNFQHVEFNSLGPF